MAAAGRAERLAPIRAHPELAGRAAVQGELAVLWRQEQGGIGLDRCSLEELARLTRLGAEYRAKFDFRSVAAVRGHTPAGIIDALVRRVNNRADAKFRECLREIARVAAIRLDDLLRDDESGRPGRCAAIRTDRAAGRTQEAD